LQDGADLLFGIYDQDAARPAAVAASVNRHGAAFIVTESEAEVPSTRSRCREDARAGAPHL
jgi:hypothetical protein